MSPEQICADTSISDKTDLYALGCLLYEMTTGDPPFDGANFARIFDQHLNSDPPQLCEKVSDCPEELGALIVRLMAKHPAQRPFNARYVQGFLKDLLEQKGGRYTSRSQTSSALSKARPSGLSPYENHSWGTILGLLGLIGLILAATFFLRHFIF
jgi:serine/threonine protein kinase